MSAPLDWKSEARAILRANLDRKYVSFKDLSRALAAIGIDEDHKALSNKITRGTFSFAFFLQCMRALNEDVVRLWDEPLESAPRLGGFRAQVKKRKTKPPH